MLALEWEQLRELALRAQPIAPWDALNRRMPPAKRKKEAPFQYALQNSLTKKYDCHTIRGMKEHDTQFAKWVEQMSFTQAEASEQLGISLSRVKDLVRGYTYARANREEREAKPDYVTRLAMKAVAEKLEPWPE